MWMWSVADNPVPSLFVCSYTAFHSSIKDGTALSKDDSKDLAGALHKWATDRGAVNFSHWFFPMRGMKVR